jgi:hypothetical protein
MSKLKLTVSDWNNGIWGNRNYFFKTVQDAKNASKKMKGKVKIYNDKNQIIHSEVNQNTDSVY